MGLGEVGQAARFGAWLLMLTVGAVYWLAWYVVGLRALTLGGAWLAAVTR